MSLIELGLFRNSFRRLRRLAISGGTRAVGKLQRQRRLLFEQPQARPEGCLQLLGFLTEEHFRGEGMTDMTAEPKHRTLCALPEHPATVGTGEDRGLLGPPVFSLLHE